MRGLIVFGFLISTIIVCVLSDNDQSVQQQDASSDVAVRGDQLEVHHRSKRSPYEPILPALVLGKSFLLGALVGKSLRRGWGWRPRHHHRGWGWKPAPVVVHHHAHGGWGGWESEPVVSHGWGGWSR